MQVLLTVFYFSWLKASDKMLYNCAVLDTLKSVSKEARQRIYQIFKILKSKSLTEAGQERKERFTQNLFFTASHTQLVLNLYMSVLPLFKSFVLSFESNKPKSHLLYEEQENLVRTFFFLLFKT